MIFLRPPVLDDEAGGVNEPHLIDVGVGDLLPLLHGQAVVLAGADRDVMNRLLNAGPQLLDEAELALQLARGTPGHVAADDAVTLARLVFAGEVALRVCPAAFDFGLLFLPPSAL